MFTASAAACATVAFAAGGAMAQKASEPDTPNAMDRQFVMMAGQGNIAEIQTGRLALKKSKDEGVRKVANMLIMQHGQAQASLKQHASMAKLKVPDAPNPAQKAMYKKLSRMSGMAFDKEFIKGQVKSHYKTIALFKKEMTNGRNSHVQSFAQRYLPDIETHTQHITAQAGKLGVPTASEVANNPAAKAGMMSGGASSASTGADQ